MGASFLPAPRRGHVYDRVELQYLKGEKRIAKDQVKGLQERYRASRQRAEKEIHASGRRDWANCSVVLDALYGLARRRSEALGEGVEAVVPFTHPVLESWCSPPPDKRTIRRLLPKLEEAGLIVYNPGTSGRPSTVGLVHLHMDNIRHTTAQVERDLARGGATFRQTCLSLLGRADEVLDNEYIEVHADVWDDDAMEAAQKRAEDAQRFDNWQQEKQARETQQAELKLQEQPLAEQVEAVEKRLHFYKQLKMNPELQRELEKQYVELSAKLELQKQAGSGFKDEGEDKMSTYTQPGANNLKKEPNNNLPLKGFSLREIAATQTQNLASQWLHKLNTGQSRGLASITPEKTLRIQRSAASISELTIECKNECGITVIKQVAKSVISEGAWATVVYKFLEWQPSSQTYGHEKVHVCRYQKRDGRYWYVPKSTASLSLESTEEIKKVVTKWHARWGVLDFPVRKKPPRFPKTIDDVSCHWEAAGRVCIREIGKHVLTESKNWATILFLFQDFDIRTQTWLPPRVAISRVRRNKRRWVFVRQFKFSSLRQTALFAAAFEDRAEEETPKK